MMNLPVELEENGGGVSGNSIVIWNNYEPVSNNYRIQIIMTDNRENLLTSVDQWTSVSEAFSMI